MDMSDVGADESEEPDIYQADRFNGEAIGLVP